MPRERGEAMGNTGREISNGVKMVAPAQHREWRDLCCELREVYHASRKRVSVLERNASKPPSCLRLVNAWPQNMAVEGEKCQGARPEF